MKYLALLDCSVSKVRIIKLDSEDIESIEQSDDTLDFISRVEKKYNFKESQCSWMIMDELQLEIS